MKNILVENMKRFKTKNLTEQENNDIANQISSKLINKTINFIVTSAKGEDVTPQQVQYKIISYEDRDVASDTQNTKPKEIVFFAKHVGTNYPGELGNSAPHQGFIFLPVAYDDAGKYHIPRGIDVKMYATAANKTNADYKNPYVMRLANALTF